MRMTDVEAAIDIVRNDEYGITWDAEKVIFFLNTLPTVEAIPVEQVAQIITRITNKMPCDIADEMCPREDGTCGESACWEYAIGLVTKRMVINDDNMFRLHSW